MLIGTTVFRIVSIWWHIILMVVCSPFMILKVAFLWFFMSFATSYIFFLVVHKFHMVYVRKDLAVALVRSFVMGFFIASLLRALYQFLLGSVMTSKFFATQQPLLEMLTCEFLFVLIVYKELCFLTVLLSGLFATHYVGDLLDIVHADHISDRYGWVIMAIALLCCGFLWVVNYIF